MNLPEPPTSQMLVDVWDSEVKGLHQANKPYYTADQMRAYAEEAVRMERERDDALLRDLRWRMDDIRDMLMKEGMGGNRIYGCDEWSTPTVNLQRAIDKIDDAIRSRTAVPAKE